MIEKIFVYGTLLEETRRKLIVPNMKVLKIQPAFINAKMFSANKKYPVAVFRNQGKRGKAPCLVYGGLLTAELDKFDLARLDSYEGCSRSSLGKNSPNDLYHRHHTKVKTFTFDDMLSFTRFDMEVDEEECTAWAYFGNIENTYINHIVNDSHNRAGHMWKSFLSAFGDKTA